MVFESIVVAVHADSCAPIAERRSFYLHVWMSAVMDKHLWFHLP